MDRSSNPPGWLQWVSLLAAPGTDAMLVDPANERIGFVPLSDAIHGGRAFAVFIRPDVVPVDLDGGDPADVDAYLGTIARLGVDRVVVPSGRPGHAHLYVKCRDERHAGQVADELRVARRGLDVDVTVRHRGRMRPPGSPHRLANIPQAVVPDAPDWGPAPATTIHSTSGSGPRRAGTMLEPAVSPCGRRSLSPGVQEHLVRGRSASSGATRSNLVGALVHGYVWAGRSFPELLDALNDPRSAGGAPWRSIRDGEPRPDGTVRTDPQRWLTIVWNTSCREIAKVATAATSRDGGSDGFARGLAALWLANVDAVDRSSWRCRWSTVRLVAGAVAAATGGDGLAELTQRQLEKATGLSRQAVIGVLRELRRLGFLTTLSTGSWGIDQEGAAEGTPSTMRLITKCTTGSTPPGPSTPLPAALPAEWADHPLLYGMSPTERLIAIMLRTGRLTLEEIIERTGVTARGLTHRQTGRRPGALAGLCDVGLVRLGADGRYRLTLTKAGARRACATTRYGLLPPERRRRRLLRHAAERRSHIQGIAERRLVHAARRINRCYPRYSLMRCRRIAVMKLPHLAAHVEPPPEVRYREVRLPNGLPVTIRLGPDDVWVPAGAAALTRAAKRAGGRAIGGTRWVSAIRRSVPVALGCTVQSKRLAAELLDRPDLLQSLHRRSSDGDWRLIENWLPCRPQSLLAKSGFKVGGA